MGVEGAVLRDVIHDEHHGSGVALAAAHAMGRPSGITCTIDLDAPGTSVGHLVAPWSRDESGWGNLLTPIAVIARGDGPTVLLTAGNHGDEFEGPVALRRLVAELDASDVSGRVIVVPALNQAALKVGRRHSPIDNANMNRSFPGNPTGSITERLAHFVCVELVRRADIVVDLHSGGTSMTFEPFVATHDLTDRHRFEETYDYLTSFGAPLAVIMREPDPIGMLDTVVEELGKVFLTTEIGGGRTVSSRTVEIAHRGVVNTLRHAGVLDGEPDVPAPPRLVRMTDDGTCMAPVAGLFEPLVDGGEEVTAGTVVGRIHDLDDLARPPHELRAEISGLVIMRHAPGLIAAGDPAASVAVDDTPPPTNAAGAAAGPPPPTG
ncbi:MAG: succinylglutamate desuccinylase/aspartoacylase family protein [Actinomycetota bacterium]|nr:succinylglutamate desuccinylase/aspartoacylase family protein [Actinomycetota bacterium]